MRRRCARILPTTVVGSYPQPNWLIDRKLLGTMVPGVGMPEMWRVPAPWLEQAQDDATLLATRDIERAGIDIVTDGEMRRESYSNRFATALEGCRYRPPRYDHRPRGQAEPGAEDHKGTGAGTPSRGAPRRRAASADQKPDRAMRR